MYYRRSSRRIQNPSYHNKGVFQDMGVEINCTISLAAASLCHVYAEKVKTPAYFHLKSIEHRDDHSGLPRRSTARKTITLSTASLMNQSDPSRVPISGAQSM
ncbi:hypothetical protein E3P86_03025 [Wallemia ichthyophaga]|uniref:Uncharacterized protein n=1 Tax=Wallemia ichthyophaga TaxID=245174 RepID=A0A4T0IWW5_WALIC|nr:hypothetical protein E3P86_03025 [Wallemia ichthyophaga]